MNLPDSVLQEDLMAFLRELQLVGYWISGFRVGLGGGPYYTLKLSECRCFYVFGPDDRRATTAYELSGEAWKKHIDRNEPLPPAQYRKKFVLDAVP